MMREFIKLNLVFLLLIPVVVSGQLRIFSAGSHFITFRYENQNDSLSYYFNPDCFYNNIKYKKDKILVTIRTDRTTYSGDTLYVFLNDAIIDYYGLTKDRRSENCLNIGKWRYEELLPGFYSRKIRICAFHKLEYKYLAIYFNISKSQSLLDHKTCLLFYDRKTNDQKIYDNVAPIKKIGAYDTPNKPKGRSLGWH